MGRPMTLPRQHAGRDRRERVVHGVPSAAARQATLLGRGMLGRAAIQEEHDPEMNEPAVSADPTAWWQIGLDHPVHPQSRWGHGRPAHPELLTIVEQGRASYEATLRGCLAYAESYAQIDREWVSDAVPYWLNGWLSPLDLIVLYATIVSEEPKTYLEVGSGSSTAFVRHAITQHGLSTRIVSVDPEPRAEIDALCD